MKKLLAFSLAALAAATVLTACNKPETPVEEQTETDAPGISIDEAMTKIDELAENEADDTTIVAKVGDYEVTLNEYRYMYTYLNQNMAYYGNYNWPETEEGVTEFTGYLDDNLKTDASLFVICREHGVTMTDEEFDTEIVKQFETLVEEQGEDFYASMGVSKHYVYESLIMSAYYNKLLGSLYAPGTEEYETAKQDTVKYYTENNYVRAKHILVQYPTNDDGSEVTDEQKAETRAKAEEILAKVDAGEDFDALIAEYGEDPGMEANPYGYYFTTGEMVPEFEEAAFALEEGAHSGIVETSYGCHIILKLPIDDEDIVNSDHFKTAAADAIQEQMTAFVEANTVEYVENYKDLVAPVEEEGEAFRQEIAAMYASYAEEAEEEAAEGEEAAESEEAAEGEETAEEELPEVEVEG